MKKCQYCGQSMAEHLLVCPHCGQPVPGALENDHSSSQLKDSVQVPEQSVEKIEATVPNIGNNVRSHSVDSGSFGWALLGFFIPLVGLILFLVCRIVRPMNANSAGISALISVVANLVFFVSLTVIVILAS